MDSSPPTMCCRGSSSAEIVRLEWLMFWVPAAMLTARQARRGSV
ncbi:hypothetical protein AAFN89_16435 [Inquilinus sp. CAU 1745]